MVVTDGGGGASTTPTTTPPGQSATPPWWSQAVGAAGAGVHGFLEGAKETGNERLRPLQKAFNDAVEKVTTNKQVQQTVGETINDLNDRLSTLKSTVPAKVDEGGKVLRKEYKVARSKAAREVVRDIRFSQRVLSELEKDRERGAGEQAAAHERLG